METHMLVETLCFNGEQKEDYDNLNYKPLLGLISKLLTHGIPEIPKIHGKIENNMLPNGYIKVDTFLKIINTFRCLTDNVKKRMTGNPFDFHFNINVAHLIIAMSSCNRYMFCELDGQMYVRSNYCHSLKLINPLLFSRDIMTKDFVLKSEIQLYSIVSEEKAENYLENGKIVKNKSYKFHSTFLPKKDLKDGDVFIYFDAENAIEKGFFLFNLNGSIVITCEKYDQPMFFPPELFSYKPFGNNSFLVYNEDI